MREPLNGRKVHRGAICGGTSRAFRSQAADSVSAMLACARALRCVFFFSTSPAQKRRHRLSAGITPMVDVWSGQSWVAGMYIVGRWPKKMAGEARDKGFTAAHYCVWISRLVWPRRAACAPRSNMVVPAWYWPISWVSESCKPYFFVCTEGNIIHGGLHYIFFAVQWRSAVARAMPARDTGRAYMRRVVCVFLGH